MTSHDHLRITPHGIARHQDVIAVFSFAIAEDGEHLLTESHGTKDMWGSIALAWAETCSEIPADTAEVHASFRIGDAQVLRYLRTGRRAIIVVLPGGAGISKSILRMMGKALQERAC